MIIEAVELTKAYKQKNVVDKVNMVLEKGETVGLLGPNGAGKSTTISMISTLIHPTDGDVRLNNESVIEHPQILRKKLGIVPQEIALYNELNARENLLFFGRIQGLSGKSLQEKIDEVLTLIGLDNRQKDVVEKYSGGMKRRLNIGVALLHDPELLIMDEPTVGIDPQSRNYILETVKRLNSEKGITVLYTSHYMEEVEYLCDRIYIMDQGKIIASGTKEELKTIISNEQTIELQVLTVKSEFIERLQSLEAIKEVKVKEHKLSLLVPIEEHIFAEIFEIAKEEEIIISSVQLNSPTLEDVFLHLTGRKLRD
ncbi:ABC transporter ATP-binding protein [Bacillus carboniphilus]|uniref:ABC transporter ATP-binding protein n=1 Tax=Bacillus carboniphilus TaxID=86663 RepID=A0ABY9JV48_9BACI|nr:ABC transporter ATP-binding protein [Bacillus carboniphilus]WLR43284.1 ABC transporter ATP-binding protein [Bacillus carboniphilus]